jgi:hypothetical protein
MDVRWEASKAALAFAQHLLSRANFVQTFCKAPRFPDPDMEQFVGKCGLKPLVINITMENHNL